MSGPIRSHPHQSPVTSVDQLVAYFRAGGKPPAAWRIGVEQEKVAVYKDGGAVPFDGQRGIEELLRRLQPRGFQPVTEGDRLLALAGRGGTITVEPGGQVEHSGPALNTAVACADELVRHVREVTEVGDTLGLHFLGVGLNPFAGLERAVLVAQGAIPHHARIPSHPGAPGSPHDEVHRHRSGKPGL